MLLREAALINHPLHVSPPPTPWVINTMTEASPSEDVMQWPYYHNIGWYHRFTPPPISALHFHHLLGTEFHHSRHSCPPSLPSSSFPPPPSSFSPQPSLSRQLCYYCLSSYKDRLTAPLWDINLRSCFVLFLFFIFFLCRYYHTGRYQSGAWRRYVLLHMKCVTDWYCFRACRMRVESRGAL